MSWAEIVGIIGITALLGTNIMQGVMLFFNSRKPWDKPMNDLRSITSERFVNVDKRLLAIEERHVFTLQTINELRSLMLDHVRSNASQLTTIDEKITDLYHVAINTQQRRRAEDRKDE